MSTQKQPFPASTLGKFITMGQLPAIRDAIVNSVMQRLKSVPKTAAPDTISIDQIKTIATEVAANLIEEIKAGLKAEILSEIKSNLTSDDSPAQLAEVLEGNTAQAEVLEGQPAEASPPEDQPVAKPAAMKQGRSKNIAELKGKAASKNAPQPDNAAATTKAEEVKPTTAPSQLSGREQLRAMRATQSEGEK